MGAPPGFIVANGALGPDDDGPWDDSAQTIARWNTDVRNCVVVYNTGVGVPSIANLEQAVRDAAMAFWNAEQDTGNDNWIKNVGKTAADLQNIKWLRAVWRYVYRTIGTGLPSGSGGFTGNAPPPAVGGGVPVNGAAAGSSAASSSGAGTAIAVAAAVAGGAWLWMRRRGRR